MYITITKQHLDATFSQSSADFIAYLEKENEGKQPELQEHFFDQHNDRVSPEQVIKDIDGNTAKLKKVEPKFYSLTINPSQRELRAIQNDPEKLKAYVREVMKDYAGSFYREEKVGVESIKYYAKIEHGRTYSGFDKEVRENQPYRAQILKLENDLRKIARGEMAGKIPALEKEIERIKKEVPHRLDGQMIEQGMPKPGYQSHVHVIVSRKDASNQFSLSPGSKYMASESILNGKAVMRGFHRNEFFEKAEKSFDRLFSYDRNYVESYEARKTYAKDPYQYFAQLLKLPTNERSAAFMILDKAGVRLPQINIPTSKVQVALQTIKQFKKAMDVARGAGSIGI